MDKLIIIAGPTGVGKTEISVKLAQEINGEIISADSMQIYKYMNIGSNKVTKEEMHNIPHYMIDVVKPDVPFSASKYKELASQKINEIIKRGNTPMLVGGTGLYISSIIYDYNFTDAYKDEDYRNKLYKIAEDYGNDYLYNKLKEVDYESYKSIHKNNLKRIIRALEVYKITGKKMSDYKNTDSKIKCPYKVFYFVFTMNRDKLYDKINKRVDMMIEKGLVNEVRSLKEKCYNADMQSMKGIGYKEILYYLNGDITLTEAVNMIKKGSRNYAKRQLTWFRRDKNVIWINKDDYKSDKEIISYIKSYLMEGVK